MQIGNSEFCTVYLGLVLLVNRLGYITIYYCKASLKTYSFCCLHLLISNSLVVVIGGFPWTICSLGIWKQFILFATKFTTYKRKIDKLLLLFYFGLAWTNLVFPFFFIAFHIFLLTIHFLIRIWAWFHATKTAQHFFQLCHPVKGIHHFA